MRCKTCEYCLWNIASRQCPECGAPFAPSTFEFRPGTVTFCCPHCDQGYYGTTPTGQLAPRSFACVQCSNTIDVDEMILRPAPGVDDSLTETESMPWLQRNRIGGVRAWFSTIGMAMVRPGRLMALTPAESQRSGQAWWFATLSNTIYLVFGWGLIMGLPMIAAAVGGAAQGGNVALQIFAALLAMGGFLLATAVSVLVMLLLWGAVTHGILRLTGSVTHPVRRTWESLCYASGANVLTAIPCMGPWFGWIWAVVSGVIAVREAQRVSGGRATLAVLTFPLTLFGGGMILYFMFVFVAVTQLGAAARTGQPQLLMVGGALDNYVRTNGAWPTHAIDLIATGWPMMDVNAQAATDGSAVLPGTTTTDAAVEHLTGTQVQALSRQIKAALPDDVVAHRFGRYVYTYHGLRNPPQHKDLWLIVMLPAPPPPVRPGRTAPPPLILACRSGRRVEEIPVASFPARLDSQNKLRATFGLPPLPDLTTVTTNQPARAPAKTAEQPDP